MAKDNRKIKIVKSGNEAGSSGPQYVISYKPSVSEDERRNDSYKILSALKGNNEVIIEMDGNLLSAQNSQREDMTISFLKDVKSLGLNFRSRKSQPTGNQSFFSQIFSFMNKASKEVYNIFAYIPDELWKTDILKSILPTNGAKYYIFKENTGDPGVLDQLFNGQILDYEKFEYFDFIAFDCSSFGQTGLYTGDFTLEYVQEKLKLLTAL